MLRSETEADPALRAAALAGLTAYQRAARDAPRASVRVRDNEGRARLLDYGGRGRPVVFVPSLINPPSILDLAAHNSLLAWLAAHGVRTLLLDWDVPTEADRAMDIAGHVERLLLPLLARLEPAPILAGYCLGGTMALAAAALHPVAGVALIAAPWRFAGFGDAALTRIAALWHEAEAPCEALGVVPMEVLQAGFWRLDPARTVAKFARFSTLAPDDPAARAFVALEDWANAGPPLALAAGRQLFADFFAADRPGGGAWRVGGRTVDPAALACPVIQFVSETDRIVPAASAPHIGAVHRLRSGHVGMVVGRRAETELWQPLADWIASIGDPR